MQPRADLVVDPFPFTEYKFVVLYLLLYNSKVTCLFLVATVTTKPCSVGDMRKIGFGQLLLEIGEKKSNARGEFDARQYKVLSN